MYHTVEFNIFAEKLNDIVYENLKPKRHASDQRGNAEKSSESFSKPIPKPNAKPLENSLNYRQSRKDK